jgi:hypothetical protein
MHPMNFYFDISLDLEMYVNELFSKPTALTSKTFSHEHKGDCVIDAQVK